MPVEIYSHLLEDQARTSDVNVTAVDKPGFGGAFHQYVIGGFNLTANPAWTDSVPFQNQHAKETTIEIFFQNGPIPQHGKNGLTIEALLAVCKHRLDCFQMGRFACEENQKALEHINQALEVLKSRTQARITRGVEGTLER